MSGKMNCTRFNRLLDAYLDSELEQSVRTEMIEHADQCPECGEKLESMTRMLTMCAELDEGLTVPLEAQAAWRKAVRAEAANRRVPRMGAWAKGLTVVAASLTVLVGSTLAMRAGGGVTTAQNDAVRMSAYKAQAPAMTTSTAANDLAGGYSVMGAAGTAYEFADEDDDWAADIDMEADGAVDLGEFDDDPGELSDDDADVFDDDDAELAEMALAEMEEAVSEEAPAAETAPKATASGAEEKSARRAPVVLRNARREIETTRFEADSLAIDDLVDEYEGYFEYSTVSGQPIADDRTGGRTREMSIRVPAEQLDEFLTSLDAVANVAYRSEEAQDISDSFYDAQARLEALKTQRDRLNELAGRAESVEEIIEVEDKLYEVQASIDSLEGRLRDWSARAAQSQVHVALREVAERDKLQPIDENLGERIRKGFFESLNWLKDFAQDMAVVLAAAAPQLVIAIPLLVLVILAVRAIRRRKK